MAQWKSPGERPNPFGFSPDEFQWLFFGGFFRRGLVQHRNK
jgi:hypothetical protein